MAGGGYEAGGIVRFIGSFEAAVSERRSVGGAGAVVDFEGFRVILDNALAYADGSKGGRPAYECVAMFKILILAAQNNVADARMEYLIRNRLSWATPLTVGVDLTAPMFGFHAPDRSISD